MTKQLTDTSSSRIEKPDFVFISVRAPPRKVIHSSFSSFPSTLHYKRKPRLFQLPFHFSAMIGYPLHHMKVCSPPHRYNKRKESLPSSTEKADNRQQYGTSLDLW